MLVEVTEQIKDLLKNPNDRVFKNNFLPDGRASEAQFLRYDSEKDEWELEMRVGFASFRIILQDHQAKALIEDKTMGHRYNLKVVDHTINEF